MQISISLKYDVFICIIYKFSFYFFLEKYPVYLKKKQKKTNMSGTISTPVIRHCISSINTHLRNNLLEILHNKKNGLPEDPAKLYKYFDARKNDIGLDSGKCYQLSKDQHELVLPPNNQEVDSQSFDITLIATLITFFIYRCPFVEDVKNAVNFRNKLNQATEDDLKSEKRLHKDLLATHNLLERMEYSRINDFVVDNIIKGGRSGRSYGSSFFFCVFFFFSLLGSKFFFQMNNS